MLESTRNSDENYHELGNRDLIKNGFLRSQTSTPICRFEKDGWRKEHQSHQNYLKSCKSLQTLLIGDSIVKGLNRYSDIWEEFFGKSTINCGIGGETQHILWRAENLLLPINIKKVFIHGGTNNIDRNTPDDIANGLICCAVCIAMNNSHTNIYITGLIPRDLYKTPRRVNITKVNNLLKQKYSTLCYKHRGRKREGDRTNKFLLNYAR